MLKEVYERLLSTVEKLGFENLKPVSVPVEVTIQEGFNLLLWIEQDRELLLKAGLDPELLSSLSDRIYGLQYAESKWQYHKKLVTDIEKENIALLEQAKSLRKEMLHYFKFAASKTGRGERYAAYISKGNSYADLIQDLYECTNFGRTYKEALDRIGYDHAMTDQAEKLGANVAEKYSMATCRKADKSSYRWTRDRFYTYLYRAVSEIRDTGKFVFRNNPDRKEGYICQHYKLHNQSK